MTVATDRFPVDKAKDFQACGYVCSRPAVAASHTTAIPSPHSAD